MQVPEIIEVKERLSKLKDNGLLIDWELPYENILTRRNAAIFFVSPASENEENLERINKELSTIGKVTIQANAEKKLSDLAYRLTFD